MGSSGTVPLDDVSRAEVWLSLPDPAVAGRVSPGCTFPVAVGDSPDAEELTATTADGTADDSLVRPRSHF